MQHCANDILGKSGGVFFLPNENIQFPEVKASAPTSSREREKSSNEFVNLTIFFNKIEGVPPCCELYVIRLKGSCQGGKSQV